MRRRRFLLGMAALSAAHRAAYAATDPLFTRPVRIIVPAAPGGFTDIAARLVQENLAPRIGQPVVVENRVGGSGQIGAEMVARSAPDGTTLLMGNNNTHAMNVGLYKKLSYDAINDFVPVTRVAIAYNILVVHPSFPATTLAEFIALAKAKPGFYTYGSAGAGASSHLAAEMLKLSAGIDLLHIPYRGTALAVQGLLGQQVSVLFDTMPSSLPLVTAGSLRSLGVTSLTRNRALPDVPAIAETLPGFEVSVWGGLYAPAGTPEPIVAALDREIQASLRVPAVAQKFENMGFSATAAGPKEFGTFTATEIAKWKDVIVRGKITQE